MKYFLFFILVAITGSLSANTGGERELKLFHTHTGESLRVVYFRRGEHDATAHPELFSQTERNFSSGCTRVKDPLKLAELIMNDPAKYNRSALQAIVDSRETQRIHTSPKMPVVITYLTASINADGGVRFYKDIYKRDQKVLDALNGPVRIQPPDA